MVQQIFEKVSIYKTKLLLKNDPLKIHGLVLSIFKRKIEDWIGN